MFAIGNKELDAAPLLGDYVKCPHCHLEHDVETAESDGGSKLSFYRCGELTYLCGINGKDIMEVEQ